MMQRNSPSIASLLGHLLVAVLFIHGMSGRLLRECPHHGALPEAAHHHGDPGGNGGHDHKPGHPADHTCHCVATCLQSGYAVLPASAEAAPEPTVEAVQRAPDTAALWFPSRKTASLLPHPRPPPENN